MKASGHTRILGISPLYKDSAACLLRDGEILSAAQEERFTREKGDASFPCNAVHYCLRAEGIGADELAAVGFYDRALLKFERILETYAAIRHETSVLEWDHEHAEDGTMSKVSLARALWAFMRVRKK